MVKQALYRSQWPKSLVEWIEDNTAYLSVVFTWDLPKAFMRAVWYRQLGYDVRAGGPACLLMPYYLTSVAEVNCGYPNALMRHNPEATFTSRGCIRKCKFCAVPKIEGDLVQLKEWQPKRIICDNNLTACTWRHFCDVVEKLKSIKGIDFQGLDARLLTKRHADLLGLLDIDVIRLAWDDTNNDPWRAIAFLSKVGIPKSCIRIYVLIGFNDTPEDAQYRLQEVRKHGYLPLPQRYNPLDALERDTYVAPNWTKHELTRTMRYWYNPHVWSVPFEEFH